MLILYVALKYDYGKPEQGYSIEHTNFYDSLMNMGHSIIYFDYGSLILELGKEKMNQKLLDIVKTEKPNLLFCVLFRDEIDKDIMREISLNTDTITLNWFCDDHWRFENFSQYWAPCFNYIVTTAESALPKYRKLGYKNVIKSQWACNHFSYKKLDLPKKYDVTFVGQPHGERREIISALRDAGIDVKVWGTGWETGRLTQEEMIKVFNQSRVNLNLSNASVLGWRHRFMRWKNRGGDQIKARNFEILGCGGFLLSGMAENLKDYYEIGDEIVCFKNVRDLIKKIKYYLIYEEEREKIAYRGYERTLREHTYERRFIEIFERIGVK